LPLCFSAEKSKMAYAYCSGLTQIRMKICGATILPENFSWSPSMLLAMAKEIDKICPEEGTFEQQDDNNDTRPADTDHRMTTSTRDPW
jgi:hypothetical protein